MKPLSISHLVIAAVLTALTAVNDAQVTIRTLESSQDSFICDEEQILICEIKPYSNTMTWSKDSSVIPLASCSFSGCLINPSMSASYNFTFDTDNGIFHMKLLKVKLADNGTIYSCANGFETDSVTSHVTVSDDFTVVNDSKKIDSNTTEVSVTTGCIYNDVAKGVKFEWWLQEVNNTSSKKRKINESESNTMYDNSVCIADPDCGESGYSFITNSVNITNEKRGKTYRIGVDVKSGVTLINSFSFDLFFILNYSVSESPTCNEYCLWGILISYAIIYVISIQMCIFEVYPYHIYLKHGYERIKLELQLAELKKPRSVAKRLKEELQHVAVKKSCLEAERKTLELQLAASKECSSEAESKTLELHIAASKDSSSEDERIKLDRQLMAFIKPRLEAECTRLKKDLAALKESLLEANCMKKRLKLLDSERSRLEADRLALETQLAASKKSSVEAERMKLELQLSASKKSRLEVERTKIELQLEALEESRLEVERVKLELQLEALKESGLEAERIKKKLQLGVSTTTRLKDEHIKLESQLAALIETFLEAERLRLKSQLEALKEPRLEAMCKPSWITVVCSFPIISIVMTSIVMTCVFVSKRWKSDHLQCVKVIILVVLLVYSLTCEIFIIPLCLVWCVCQWYTLILVIPDLICRWLLCIIIADLYYGEEDIQKPATGRIAWSCMPIVGFIYNLKPYIVNILPCKSSRILPVPDVCNHTNETSQIPIETPYQQEPRSLQKFPRVTSNLQIVVNEDMRTELNNLNENISISINQ